MVELIQSEFELFKFSSAGSTPSKSERFNHALSMFAEASEPIDAKLYLETRHSKGSLIWTSGGFEDESIERYDYTTLHLYVYSKVDMAI